MKYTNLELVNKCAESINYDPVTSISGDEGAEQILSIIEDVYYDLLSRVNTPNDYLLGNLTATETTSDPTTFSYEDGATDYVKKVVKVEYNQGGTDYATAPDFQEVCWMDPKSFMDRSNMWSDNYDVVEVSTDVFLKIRNDVYPKYYTSFDQSTIYMDSYDSDVESFLITEKTRVLFEKVPDFATSDATVQRLDSAYWPTYVRECQSMVHAIMKDGVSPKIEAVARKNRMLTQNDRRKDKEVHDRAHYGRR